MTSIRGDRLKELRKKRGLRQEDIASKLGINRVSYAHYESNTNTPPSDKLSLIVDILNTNADYLLGKTDDPAPGLRQLTLDPFTGEMQLLSQYDTEIEGEISSKIDVKRSLNNHIRSVEDDDSLSTTQKKAITQPLYETIDKIDQEIEDLRQKQEQRKQSYPEWATAKDKRDLEKYLEDMGPLFYKGVEFSEEDKAKMIGVAESIFWDAKRKNKEAYKKSRQKNKDNQE